MTTSTMTGPVALHRVPTRRGGGSATKQLSAGRGTYVLLGAVLLTSVFPLYIMMANWFHWSNHVQALILPSAASAFGVFFMRQYLVSALPTELLEAGRIDGCSTFGIFWRILLPLTKPAVAVVAILWFQSSWTDLLGPVIYINSANKYTLAIGVYSFAASNASMAINHEEWLMCVAFAMVLPVAAIFLAAQRYMIRGVVLSGIKG